MARSKSPLISVVMPVYNGDDYFASALQSVLNQTWQKFEVVVVDDGSHDPRFVERLCASSGPRVTYHYQENSGVAGALNHGITHMEGDVFCWLSHDDLFHPRKLERQAAYHAQFDNPDAILFSDYNLIDASGAQTGTIRASHERLVRAPQLALLNGCINGCTIYIPGHIVRDSGGFELNRRYTQDYYFWNTLMKSYDFFHQPEALVDYRVHTSQGSNTAAAVAEAEQLWITIAEDRTEFERVAMYGSSYQFFAQIANHLAASPYRVAEVRLRERAAAAVGESLLSVICLEPMTERQVELFKSEHIGPLHQRTEIVWRDPESKLLRLMTSEGRSNAFPDVSAASLSDFLNNAVDLSVGDYVTFLRSPTQEAANRMAVGLVAAHQQGETIGLTNLPTGTAVAARDLLISSEPMRALELSHWFFHRTALLRAPRFASEVMGAGENAMLASLLGGATAVGLYDKARIGLKS